MKRTSFILIVAILLIILTIWQIEKERVVRVGMFCKEFCLKYERDCLTKPENPLRPLQPEPRHCEERPYCNFNFCVQDVLRGRDY